MRLLRWLGRLRHRSGYGIHSPWAYRLTREVILQRLPYYAYAPLARRYGSDTAHDGLREKDLRLLLRLAVEAQADALCVVGREEATRRERAYLRAGARAGTPCRVLSENEPKDGPAPHSAGRRTLLYLADAALWPEDPARQAQLVDGAALIVVRHPHATARSLALAGKLAALPTVSDAFDLWDFLLLWRRKQPSRNHYIVNYY